MRLLLPLAVLLACAAPAAALPPLPHGWPDTLQIGLADPPGGAAALRRSAPFGFRYQYLAGGVDTGQGWATWNPDGTFASMYVEDSWAHHVVPVLTYYMLLQSSPKGGGGSESQTDLSHLADPQLMQAYWNDVRLLFRRVRGTQPVVVHVEPDLWGYIEQKVDGATCHFLYWQAHCCERGIEIVGEFAVVQGNQGEVLRDLHTPFPGGLPAVEPRERSSSRKLARRPPNGCAPYNRRPWIRRRAGTWSGRSAAR